MKLTMHMSESVHPKADQKMAVLTGVDRDHVESALRTVGVSPVRLDYRLAAGSTPQRVLVIIDASDQGRTDTALQQDRTTRWIGLEPSSPERSAITQAVNALTSIVADQVASWGGQVAAVLEVNIAKVERKTLMLSLPGDQYWDFPRVPKPIADRFIVEGSVSVEVDLPDGVNALELPACQYDLEAARSENSADAVRPQLPQTGPEMDDPGPVDAGVAS